MSNQLQDESSLVSSINELNEQDFKIIAEASIIFLNDKDKIERLSSLNQSLMQSEKDCKEKAKWVLKQLTICMKQNIEPAKIGKHFHLNLGLDEPKSNIIKLLVNASFFCFVLFLVKIIIL